MLVPERRRRLLGELRRSGSGSVESLADALGVSRSTVRRDLALMATEGLLHRTHGGAYLDAGDHVGGPPAGPSGTDNAAAKDRIGAAAANLVLDGMTIMILAGSTTQTMLAHLAERTVTVVTNGLDIGHELSRFPSISLVMLGGVLQREQMTLLGPLSEQSMADLHVDIMFAGAYGIDPVVGVTGAKVIQAGNHHSMLRHTESLAVLADSTKLNRRGPTLLAGIDQIDTLVTDTDADPATVASLRSQGPGVLLC